jgi:ribose-phosphate pyrophosphokinase
MFYESLWRYQVICRFRLPGIGAKKLLIMFDYPLCEWDVIDFPNENLFVRLNGSVRGQDVFLIQSHSRPVHRNIMEMLIAIDCLKRDSAGRITVVIPFMAYSQSDKKDQPRVPITARLLADMIEVAGADRWVTIDLHADQIQGFYKIPGDALTASYIIVRLFPEEGAGCRCRHAGFGVCEKGAELCRQA